MRLRSFTADTMQGAMAQVRRELGPDAIIVATQKSKGAAQVTAAVDAVAHVNGAHAGAGDCVDAIRDMLVFHELGEDTATRLLTAIYDIAVDRRGLDAHALLAFGLDRILAFDALPADAPSRTFLLMGPPGAGKSSLTAKLAARARAGMASVRVITTDTVRSGGVAQLQTYADALGMGLRVAEDCDELSAVLAAGTGAHLTLIDSTGVNPADLSELEALARLYRAGDMDPLLVLDASVDRALSVDWAHAFAALGCRAVVFTKLDLCPRLGGLLETLHATQLRLLGVSTAAQIADGFEPLNPAQLAHRLLAGAASEHPTDRR